MAPVLVAGLGNPFMTDEGVGVHVVHALCAQDLGPDVEVRDLGAGAGLDALHAIADRRRAVFVDCARMGEKPGVVRRFAPDQVRTAKPLAGASLHEGDLLRTLELARQLDQCPPEVVILGIEPECIEPGEGLSDTLLHRLDEYVAAVAAEARRPIETETEG